MWGWANSDMDFTEAMSDSLYWRPSAKRIKSKYYDAAADRALPAVVFGLVGQIGSVGEQHMALMTNLIRADLTDPSEQAL
jgi:hypothetical protein